MCIRDRPVADAATPFEITKDIDGQSRQNSKPDIGADEVSGATGERLSAPLTPADVGVSFLRGQGPEKN